MLRKNPTAAVEADIAQLEKRRAGLDTRRATAAMAAQAATAARRALLVDSDEPDASALTAADRACRDTADAEGAAVDALTEVDSRIATLRERLAQLRETAERERRASAIEADAKAAEAAVERIRRAAQEIAAARLDLVAAISPEAVICYAPPSNAVVFGPSYLTQTLFYDHRGQPTLDTLDADQVAARIVGHLVAPALPGLGIARLEDATELRASGRPTPVLGPVDGEVAASLLTDPMRAAAAEVRRAPEVA